MKYFIDVGSNNSCSARVFRKLYDTEAEYYIYSFEANPKFCNCYKDIPKHTFINKAVWVKDGELSFYLSEDVFNAGSSIFKNKRTGNLDKTPPIKVKAIDFSKWVLDNLSETDYIILKMDIEGAEYPLLNKMLDDGSFKYIDELWIEWHWQKINLPEVEHNTLLNKIDIPIKKWYGIEKAKKLFGGKFFKRICLDGK